MLQLMRAFLAKGYQITYATTAGESVYAHDLSSEGIANAKVEVNDTGFDAWVQQIDPTLVLFDRFMVEEQFGWRVRIHCPSAIRILDTEDLHCLRYAREAAVKERRSFVEEDLYRDIAFREIASILRCDLSLMISSYEMALLQRVFSVDASLLHYMPFLEDPNSDASKQSWLSFEQRAHFISIGNFMHAPNLDAVKQLKEVVWPKIRARLPKVELHVYGAYPTQQVLEWNDPMHGFLVKGRAEEAEAVIGQARVMLAPLRFGAGLKGKLVDAMRCGTPSVTSTIGAEGMLLGKDWPGRVEDEEDAFVHAAVDLYSEEARWNDVQMHCTDLINGAFNGKGHVLLFWNRMDHLMAELEQHRRANFMGGMLWHHSTRSTEYMSKWIEAKNKGQR